MTPREYISLMRGNLEAMNANRDQEVMIIAFDLTALVKQRVQTSGLDSSEQPFSPYTPEYAKYRAKGGYQVGYVDFTVSGRLWASIRPRVIRSDKYSTTIEVTTRDEHNQDILKGASIKRGNIIYPSLTEIGIAAQANRERIQKYLS